MAVIYNGCIFVSQPDYNFKQWVSTHVISYSAIFLPEKIKMSKWGLAEPKKMMAENSHTEIDYINIMLFVMHYFIVEKDYSE